MSLLIHSLNKYQTLKKGISGVTLIELLVVIVLLGITITLVGPFTFKQIESSRARNEQLSLQRWLQKQSFYAFTSQSNLTIKFDGKAIYSIVEPQTSPLEQQLLSHNTNQDTESPMVSNKFTTNKISHFKSIDDFLQFDDNQQNLATELKPTQTFDFIFFEPQQLNINDHGYFDTAILTYRLRGLIVELNVLDLIEGVDDES